MKKTFRELAHQRKDLDQEYKAFMVQVKRLMKEGTEEAEFKEKQEMCSEMDRLVSKLADTLRKYASDIDDVIKMVRN